jgi:phosphatidate cytidylyltransferase
MGADDDRARRNGLLVRLTVAPAILVALCALLWWHDATGTSAPTDAVLALLAAGAAYEMGATLARAGRPVPLPLVVLACAALGALGLLHPDDPAARGVARSLVLAGAAIAAFAGHLRAVRPGDLDRLTASLLPVVFVGYLFSLLREVGDGPLGARQLALVMVASKASDIGGWVVGKTMGRHKMIPSVSPGKTWEGTAGGIALSVAAAVGLHAAIGPLPALAVSPGEAAVLGGLLGLASVVAGLAHSAFKRRCAVKDSSALLPEMGGLLDMIDSFLFAAPVAWAWFLLR